MKCFMASDTRVPDVILPCQLLRSRRCMSEALKSSFKGSHDVVEAISREEPRVQYPGCVQLHSEVKHTSHQLAITSKLPALRAGCTMLAVAGAPRAL